MDDAQDIDMAIDDAATSAQAPPPPAFFTTLVAPLLRLVQPTALSFPPVGAPSPHPPTTSALGAIHVSALECLNNIFLSMATSLAGRPSGLASENGRTVFDAVWGALGAVGTEISGAGQERRKEMWDIGVGVLWGVGNVWKGGLVPTEEQVQVLSQFCGATTDTGVKVKTIGTLECLAQHPESVDTNRVSRCDDCYLDCLLPLHTSVDDSWKRSADTHLFSCPRLGRSPYRLSPRTSCPYCRRRRTRRRPRSRYCRQCLRSSTFTQTRRSRTT